MKPLGMTQFLEVVRPTLVEDKIWAAVQEAQCTPGWTPRRFLAEAREAWAQGLRDDAKATDEEFSRG